jgi:hypothetical protein
MTKKQNIAKLSFQARNAIMDLRELAKTDLSALDALATELKNYILALNRDAIENPEYYRKLTRKCSHWPGFASVDNDIQDEQLWFSKVMELGADSPLNYSSKKQWSRRTSENRIIIELINSYIHQNGKPPESWKQAFPLFELYYGKQFEKHQKFSKLFPEIPANVEKANKKAQLFATWRRDQIRKKMEQAFRTLTSKK